MDKNLGILIMKTLLWIHLGPGLFRLTHQSVLLSSTAPTQAGAPIWSGIQAQQYSVKARMLAGPPYLRASVSSALILSCISCTGSKIVASAVLAESAALSKRSRRSRNVFNGTMLLDSPFMAIRGGPSRKFRSFTASKSSRVNKRTRNANFSSTDS